ncbi:MAG: AraC family transcriptional regulator [Tannerella sp.]|jgi:AraC-like DNA-binding protein|nr:AraC family transcriptional regulator [Tannerella sp.]
MIKRNAHNFLVDEIFRLLGSFAIKDFIVFDENNQISDHIYEYSHHFDGIVFSVCTKGSARFKINLQEYTLCSKMIVMILPNMIIEPVEISEDFFLKSLFFSFDFVADLPLYSDFDLFEIIEKDPCILVSDEDYRNLLKFHSFIAEQNNRKEESSFQEIAKGLLLALLAEVSSLYSDKENVSIQTQSERLFGKFFSLVRKHHKNERKIAFYATTLCLSPKYLSSKIKKKTRKSILVWIHEAVIASAKIQLKSSNETIEQISEKLNFTDSSSFCRFFRKHTGMTPLQYRKK